MKLLFTRTVRFAALLGLLAGSTGVWSQSTTELSPSTPSASAPSLPLPGPSTTRPIRPTDAQRPVDAVNAQPEGKVTPQIRIPFGQKPIEPVPKPGARAGGGQASSPLGNDAAARCEALRGEQVRAKCRDRLARESR